MASSRRDFLKQSGLGIAGGSLLALAPELGAAPLRLSRALKVGLAGVGRQGRVVLGELAKFDDVQLVAICDTDPSRLRAGKRRARGAEAYASVSEMLDKQKGLDAVIVATPTHTHREVAEQCLAAKLHVYCESPLASTEEDARALAQASRGASRILQCGMQGRSNPVYSLARSFFRAGAIGKTLGLRAQWHKKTSWRTPAPSPELEKARNWRLDPKLTMGLLGEMGAQQFDVFHWMLDAYPTEVYARGAVLAWEDGREVEDTVSCELHFDDGVSLHYDACLANSFEGANELLYGKMGTIKLSWTHGWMFKEADAPTQGWEVYANRQQFHNDEGITLIAGATKLAEQGKLKAGVGLPHAPLYYALADFLKSITESKPVVCTAEEGMRASLISLAAQRSLRSGKPVAISTDELKGAGK
jgi:predicted dehydrogenase